MAYFDTCVLVSYYHQETLTDMAQEALRSERHPQISQLTEVEFRSTISMKVRMGHIDSADGSKIVAAFQAHVSGGTYRLLPFGSKEFLFAGSLLASFDHNLRTLDALHLAVAHIHDLELVTSDKSLHKCAKALKFRSKLLS